MRARHPSIILKIGAHCGPSIAVTLNENLDYFGQTVNVAARVQSLADAGEICISEALYSAPGVSRAAHGPRRSSSLMPRFAVLKETPASIASCADKALIAHLLQLRCPLVDAVV